MSRRRDLSWGPPRLCECDALVGSFRNLEQGVDQLAGVEAERFCKVEQLDEIEPALSGLHLRHERLMPSQSAATSDCFSPAFSR